MTLFVVVLFLWMVGSSCFGTVVLIRKSASAVDRIVTGRLNGGFPRRADSDEVVSPTGPGPAQPLATAGRDPWAHEPWRN